MSVSKEVAEKVEELIRLPRDQPGRWEIATVAEVAEIVMGQSPPSEYYNTEGKGLPFFQGKAEFGDLYPEVVKWCSVPGKIAHKDDVLISIRAPVGPTNFASSKCCIGRGLAAIRPKLGIAPKYILYYLRSIEKDIDMLGTGTTFKAISGKVLRQIPIPIAPPDQQKHIVANIEKQFSRLDEAVANLKRVKANLKRYRAAVLKAAVEGRLVETEAEVAHHEGRGYETGEQLLQRILEVRRKRWRGKSTYREPTPPDTTALSKLPDGWVWATVEELSDLVEYGSSAKTSEDSSEIPVFRMSNICDGELKIDNLKYLPASHHEFPRLLLKPGDLLFNRTNSPELVGKTALFSDCREQYSFASYLIRVRLIKGCVPAFLAMYINSSHGRRWVRSVVTQQVGQANVNGTKLRALVCPLPPLLEQRRIVSEADRCLSVARTIEAQIGANIARVESLRHLILTNSFSGRQSQSFVRSRLRALQGCTD